MKVPIAKGTRVCVVGGDHDGQTGTYEGRDEDVFGEWHLVHLDGDGLRDSAIQCDTVAPSYGHQDDCERKQ